MATQFDKIIEALNKSPTQQTWEKFAKALKGSKAKFYRTVYVNSNLKNVQDLRSSYVELYDAKKHFLAKVPIFMLKDGKVAGATYYLKGLRNINKVVK